MLLDHKLKKEGINIIFIFIIAINILVFVVEYANGRIRSNDYFYSIGAFRYSSTIDFYVLKRSIMCQFIHNDFIHLCTNMISLAVLLKELKKYKSTLYILIIYVGGLITVAVALICFGREGVVYIGNSGAIYALFGSYIYIKYINRGIFKINKEMFDFIFIIVITSFIPNTSILMHLSGILGGVILSYHFHKRIRGKILR